MLLGEADGVAYWAVRDPAELVPGEDPVDRADLRSAGAALDALGAGLLTTAVAVLNWHDTARFCGRDGSRDPPSGSGLAPGLRGARPRGLPPHGSCGDLPGARRRGPRPARPPAGVARGAVLGARRVRRGGGVARGLRAARDPRGGRRPGPRRHVPGQPGLAVPALADGRLPGPRRRGRAVAAGRGRDRRGDVGDAGGAARMPWRRATGRARRARDCCCRAPSRSPGRCWRRGPRSADPDRARTCGCRAARHAGSQQRGRPADLVRAGSCEPSPPARGAPVVHSARAVAGCPQLRAAACRSSAGAARSMRGTVLHRAAAARGRLRRGRRPSPAASGCPHSRPPRCLRGAAHRTTATLVMRCSFGGVGRARASAPWPVTCPRPWCTAFRRGACRSSGPT